MPVDGFHRFIGDAATCRVPVLSLFHVTDAKAPEVKRSETATRFNELRLLAPARRLAAALRADLQHPELE